MPKFVVCPDCQGEGTKGPGFVYTAEEIHEQFAPGEFEEFAEQMREGVFDEVCSYCRGKRVVEAVVDGVPAEQRWREECEYRAERDAEMRMGC